MFESYSDYKLNHRSIVKRTSFQPICSLHEVTRLWIFDKNFFSKSWASKIGVQLICECGLYAGVYGIYIYIMFITKRYLWNKEILKSKKHKSQPSINYIRWPSSLDLSIPQVATLKVWAMLSVPDSTAFCIFLSTSLLLLPMIWCIIIIIITIIIIIICTSTIINYCNYFF